MDQLKIIRENSLNEKKVFCNNSLIFINIPLARDFESSATLSSVTNRAHAIA